MITGHCECGRVQFEVDSDINDFSHCHCSQCRRLHGAPFVTFAGVAQESFRYVSGESDVKVYASSDWNDRYFCGECGSQIYVDAKEEPEVLYVCMGTVDGNPPHPPGYHAYAGSKAEWYEIGGNLPQYETDSSS